MTKKQDSNGSKPNKRPGETGVEWIDRRRRPAREALEALSNDDLAEVLCWELDRRRLDADGNPTDPEGMHHAVNIGTRKLLGQQLDPAAERIAENVAAVGRGVRVRSKTQDHSKDLRQLADMLPRERNRHGFLEGPGADYPKDGDPAELLAVTLSKKYRRKVKPEKVAYALEQRGRRQKIEWLARAVGIETSENAIKAALQK